MKQILAGTIVFVMFVFVALPAVAGGDWYVGLDYGYAYTEDTVAEFTGREPSEPVSFHEGGQKALAVNFGYVLDEAWSFELSYVHTGRLYKSYEWVARGVREDVYSAIFVDSDAVFLSANYNVLSLAAVDDFKLNFGVGAGISFNESGKWAVPIEDSEVTGASNESFAWKASLEGEYFVTDSISVNCEYTYFDLGTVGTGVDVYQRSTGVFAQKLDGPLQNLNITGHMFTVGAKYHFDWSNIF